MIYHQGTEAARAGLMSNTRLQKANGRAAESGNSRFGVYSLRFAIGLLGLLVFSPLRAAQSDQFGRANAAYEAGAYEQALVLYDSAATQGRSAAHFYNRGNARFKLGQVGRAIADYNRAWVRAPQDRDIRYNLAFARQFRPDKTLTLENPLMRIAAEALRCLDVGAVRLLAGLFFVLALGALALLLVRGERLFGWLAIGLGGLFLYCFFSQLSWGAVVNRSRAVVVVPELTLRSGPGSEYKDIAIIHDGLEASIREARPGWVLIQMPGGEGGWAETGAVERIF
jgi:tetratricopeptide (TPR) repeat protein